MPDVKKERNTAEKKTETAELSEEALGQVTGGASGNLSMKSAPELSAAGLSQSSFKKADKKAIIITSSSKTKDSEKTEPDFIKIDTV